MLRRTKRKLRNISLVFGAVIIGLIGAVFLVDVPKDQTNQAQASEFESFETPPDVIKQNVVSSIISKIKFIYPSIAQRFEEVPQLDSEFQSLQENLQQLEDKKIITAKEKEILIEYLEQRRATQAQNISSSTTVSSVASSQ